MSRTPKELETNEHLERKLQLYVRRIRASKHTRMGWIIQYVQGDACDYDIDEEINQLLTARLLVPAVECLHPTRDIKKYAIECIARFDAYAQILREQYGIPAISRPISGSVVTGSVLQRNDDSASNGKEAIQPMSERVSFNQQLYSEDYDNE